jgi:hypothetical protein
VLSKAGFIISIFKIPKVFVETDFKRTSSLSYVLLVACRACYLVDPAVIIFTLRAVASSFPKVLFVVSAAFTLVFLKALVIALLSFPM